MVFTHTRYKLSWPESCTSSKDSQNTRQQPELQYIHELISFKNRILRKLWSHEDLLFNKWQTACSFLIIPGWNPWAVYSFNDASTTFNAACKSIAVLGVYFIKRVYVQFLLFMCSHTSVAGQYHLRVISKILVLIVLGVFSCRQVTSQPGWDCLWATLTSHSSHRPATPWNHGYGTTHATLTWWLTWKMRKISLLCLHTSTGESHSTILSPLVSRWG